LLQEPQALVNVWEKRLIEDEWWILQIIFRELAFVCDFVMSKVRFDGKGYRATSLPCTKWPKYLVKWNHDVQLLLLFVLARYVLIPIVFWLLF
jgi:hypothetical protein